MRVWMASLAIVGSLLMCGSARADETSGTWPRFIGWREIERREQERRTVADERASSLVTGELRKRPKAADRAFVLDGGVLETHLAKRVECDFSVLALSCKTRD